MPQLTWLGLITLALSSSVLAVLVGKLFDRSSTRAENLRDGYADATRALNSWGQFPLRIRRRTDDSADTLKLLESMGAQIQESLAYSTGWVASESPVISEIYEQLVTLLRGEVAVHAREAWAQPPAKTANLMNLSPHPVRAETHDSPGILPAEWVIVQLFSHAIRYRFGWRRYLLPSYIVRRRLQQLQLVKQAREALRERSARLLINSP